MTASWSIPVAHQVAVDRFIAGWPVPLGPSSAAMRAPQNVEVLAFAHSLANPVIAGRSGADLATDLLLARIAWAALGYRKPGDKFRVDASWLRSPFDDAADLAARLRGWATQVTLSGRTLTIAAPNKLVLDRDPAAVQRDALYWWQQLQNFRRMGMESTPPRTAAAPVDPTEESVRALAPGSTQSMSPAVFWFAIIGLVGAGLGAAYLVARRR